MKNEKWLLAMGAATLLGIVGLYVLLGRAYQIYQEKTAPGTAGGTLANLAGLLGGK